MPTMGYTVESERLKTLSKYKILDTPPEPSFDRFTALAARFCETPISLLTFIDEKRQWIKANVGFPFVETPREISFCAHQILEPEASIVPDAKHDPRFAENPLVRGTPFVRFYAGFPLISPEGHSLGMLCVMDRRPRDLDFEQEQTLRILSQEVMAFLQLRRELIETKHRNARNTGRLTDLAAKLERRSVQQREVEKELRQREHQLEEAQRIAQLGSWTWDIRSNTIAWSAQLYRIFGLALETFHPTPENYLSRIHPDDRNRTKQAIEHALKNGTSFILSERIIRSDGEIRFLCTQGEVVKDDRGQAIRAIGCCQDVTEQKLAEQKLEESVSLLDATLESTADGILVVDLNGKPAGYNCNFVRMWHLPANIMESYEDRRILAMVIEQLKNPEAFLKKVEALYKDPGAESFDVLEFKDGRIFERYSKPQRIRGKTVGRVWSFRDVTKRYEALETLRHSEERYRSLVIATAQIVWTTNAAGDVTEDIPTWRNFTGQKLEDILGRGWLNAIHPKDRHKTSEIWSHAVATRCIYQTEYRLRRTDGEWRRMSVRGVPVIEEGDTIREWVGLCYDITDRKKAEEAIVDERDFSETIINSLPGIFYLTQENGKQLRWNRNFEIISEYSAAEIATMHNLDFVPPEEHELLNREMEKVFVAGESEVELTLLSKSGKRIPFFCTGRLANFHGKPCLIGMGIDISSRKKAEEAVTKLNEDLERRVRERTAQLKLSNKELEAFSYTVSHDLRAPLRAISGFVSALEEDCRDRLNVEDRLYLTRIKHAGERMTHLIEDLLTYSRIGRTGVNLRSISLQEIAQQTAEDFLLRLKATGGRFSLPNDLPKVTADPTLLGQVLGNLFENAINYRKKDSPPIINVTWREAGDNIVVSVADNGIGIAPTYHEKIFEVFQRLHPNDKLPGTGIGLANARKAMEKLNGRIWVESEPGKGSVFSVELKRG